jgi:molybdopterin-guanine dinucleotide biosynthesis protein A
MSIVSVVQPWSAVILTGGRSERFGRDKAGAVLGGRSLLRRVVDAVPGDVPVILVGPEPDADLGRAVHVAREDPPGGGPVAGVVAALPLVGTPIVVLLATDLPFLGDLPARLARDLAERDADAVLALDATGREQPLCGAYRTAALRASATALGGGHGAAMRALVAPLRRANLPPLPATVDPAMDVDTPADLARARGALMMEDWIDAVRLDLGIPDELDVDEVLDVAKDVAHHVQRPAAPVTTYLLGLAVGSGMPLHEAAAKIRELASGWVADQ